MLPSPFSLSAAEKKEEIDIFFIKIVISDQKIAFIHIFSPEKLLRLPSKGHPFESLYALF